MTELIWAGSTLDTNFVRRGGRVMPVYGSGSRYGMEGAVGQERMDVGRE